MKLVTQMVHAKRTDDAMRNRLAELLHFETHLGSDAMPLAACPFHSLPYFRGKASRLLPSTQRDSEEATRTIEFIKSISV